MITILKLAGLSAVLSAGLVTGYTGPEQKLGTEPAKIFYDRVQDGATSARVTLASADPRAFGPVEVNISAKGDRARAGRDVRCSDTAWLLMPADCVPNFETSSTTSEVRSNDNVSSLIRAGRTHTVASR